jgi:succinate-acetate transporter protein
MSTTAPTPDGTRTRRVALRDDDPTEGQTGALRREGGPAPLLADPAPFGLTALALPLFAFSWINIGMIKAAAMPVVLTTILLYGGLGQVIVALWEVRRGNTFGVAAFGTFGCFNLSVWYFFTHAIKTIPPAQQPSSLALFIALWAVPAFILWVASFRTTIVVNLIFMLATALFIAAAIGQGQADLTMIRVSGWIGIALAVVAWYGCLSALTAETFERTIFPNPHLGRKRA